MTVVANLYAVGKYHHAAKHSPGFSYEPALGGLVWSTPGRRYFTPDATPPGVALPGTTGTPPAPTARSST